MKIIAKNSNHAMKLLLNKLKKAKETAPRGLRIKELINVNLTIKDISDKGFITKYLPVNKKYANSEIKLYESGSNLLEHFSSISKFWNKVSDDQKTVRSAYGYIIKYKHNFDQYDYILDQLVKDLDTRKAVITFKTPYQNETKDNICTLSMQFFIRDNKLDLIVNMRSNDIEYGFRNDLPYFIYLQNKLKNDLNKKVKQLISTGEYHHNVGSLHAYERTIKKLWERG